MASRKGAPARKKKTTKKRAVTSPQDDWITIRYGTVVYYVFIGLIIGLAIGALLLLWISQIQASQVVVDGSLQSQLLLTNPYLR